MGFRKGLSIIIAGFALAGCAEYVATELAVHAISAGVNYAKSSNTQGNSSSDTSSFSSTIQNDFRGSPDNEVCVNRFVNNNARNEAKRRGLGCGVTPGSNTIQRLDFDLDSSIIKHISFSGEHVVALDLDKKVFYYHNTYKDSRYRFNILINYFSIPENKRDGHYALTFTSSVEAKNGSEIPWEKAESIESVKSSTGKDFLKVQVKNFKELLLAFEKAEKDYFRVRITSENGSNIITWSGLYAGRSSSIPLKSAIRSRQTTQMASVPRRKSAPEKAYEIGTLCDYAAVGYPVKRWRDDGGGFGDYVKTAKLKGLTCGVDETGSFTQIATGLNAKPTARSLAAASNKYRHYDNSSICSFSTTGNPIYWDQSQPSFVQEAKRRGLSCGVGEASSSTQTASAPKVKTKVTSAALTAAEKEAERLRQRVAALEAEKAKQQQTISSDTQKPTITASASSNGTDGIISGTVRDNVEVAEVLVGGQVVALNADGSFKTSLYVPRSGKTVEIVAVDTKGNKATKSLFLERGAVQGATGPVFASLNPSGKRVKVNKDALALIIGVADYERTPAKAAYADKDAKTFYDYAMLKLGISAGNIKELVNVDANRIDVSLAIKDWIARTTKQGSSDIYVFFAGHGLASQSGEQMYLLPYDGSPRLLEDSAISRDRLFADISAANPRSVTVFLDTCYSGTTRGTDMLIASRPIAIKALKQSVPDNFTVMTAARGDQTAKPLEEAKHGMFSYFLMKGMEGEADSNQDNQITAGELHQYVQSNVIQQSSGSQTPELQGDANRVLVQFQ